MLAQREAGNAVERIGDNAAACGEVAQPQLQVGQFEFQLGKAGPDLALGIRMQLQLDAGSSSSSLSRVIVRRVADAAKAEHDVVAGQRAA